MKVCIVQARLGSSRLPGKVMLSLGGEPVIRHVLRRCMDIAGIDKVICAVPDSPDSRPIERESKGLKCAVYRGSENDVLSRYYKAAWAVRAKVIMRVTADCPLIDPEICAKVLELLENGADYASNIMPRGFPDGLDCEAFTMDALEQAHQTADDPYDREHVTIWMQRNLHCVNLDGTGNPDKRLTLDSIEDYVTLSNCFT